MMCYYLNAHFQGQTAKISSYICSTVQWPYHPTRKLSTATIMMQFSFLPPDCLTRLTGQDSQQRRVRKPHQKICQHELSTGTPTIQCQFYVHGSVRRESISIIVQQVANIYSLLYFCNLLCMFRVVPPPIIRRAYNCIYSIWHLSDHFCHLPLSWSSWNSLLHDSGRQQKRSDKSQMLLYALLMMGGGTTRNIQSSLQKYNKLHIVASYWTIIDKVSDGLQNIYSTNRLSRDSCVASYRTYLTHFSRNFSGSTALMGLGPLIFDGAWPHPGVDYTRLLYKLVASEFTNFQLAGD